MGGSRELGSLWEMNCLFYVGATALQQESQEVGPQARVWENEETEGLNLDFQAEQGKLEKRSKPNCRIREIRRGIGWLEAELTRKQSPGMKLLSKKQKLRLGKI